MAGEGLPYEAVRDHISSAVDVIVHLGRRPDGSRVVSEVCVVHGYSPLTAGYELAKADRSRALPLSAEQAERVEVFRCGGGSGGA